MKDFFEEGQKFDKKASVEELRNKVSEIKNAYGKEAVDSFMDGIISQEDTDSKEVKKENCK